MAGEALKPEHDTSVETGHNCWCGPVEIEPGVWVHNDPS